MQKCFRTLILLILAAFLPFSFSSAAQKIIRVGYFPNITHSQAVIGISNGSFQKALGKDTEIIPHLFNAGPSVIEALFAGEIDLAYIGPNPAINGYVKSKGEALRIVCGVTSGGAGLVVRKDAGIAKIEDFHAKRIASPQLGNTQDVALRRWLKNNGLVLKEYGGDVQVMPINNPDQLSLFLKKEIDGAWTVEPWVSRLIKEGGGRLFLDERSLWPNAEFVTANIIVSKKFLEQNREVVKRWLACHVDLTAWINENLPEAKKILNARLQNLTGKSLPEEIIDAAFSRLKVTYDPVKKSLFTSAQWAFELGFLGEEMPDLSGIYELTILNEVLKENGLKEIE